MATKIFNECGKGYWAEGTGCLRANETNGMGAHIVCLDNINATDAESSNNADYIVAVLNNQGENKMIALGCDMYNGTITGNTACALTANTGASANHAGPKLIVLNDQGGGAVIDLCNDITATLRAQCHGHPPVICFEPGIMSRDCSAGNRAYIDVCSTLRAQMGDNQPAICYENDS